MSAHLETVVTVSYSRFIAYKKITLIHLHIMTHRTSTRPPRMPSSNEVPMIPAITILYVVLGAFALQAIVAFAIWLYFSRRIRRIVGVKPAPPPLLAIVVEPDGAATLAIEAVNATP